MINGRSFLYLKALELDVAFLLTIDDRGNQ